MRQSVVGLSATMMMAAAGGTLGLLCGCSSIVDGHTQKAPMMAQYLTGNPKEAEKEFTERAADRTGTGDELMWRLDEANVKFENGDYPGSLKAFERSEALVKDFDSRATVSVRDVGAEAGSAMVNPNAIPYRGFCYERILLNTVKALDYFALGNPADAMVELRRLREYQKQLSKRFADDLKAEEKEIQQGTQASAQQMGAKATSAQTDALSFGSIQKTPAIAEAVAETDRKAANAYGALLNPFAVYMSALGYYAENNYAEALVDLRSLYKMSPNNPLFVRDYVTVGRTLSENFPDASLHRIQPWSYSLKNNIVYVIFANGQGPSLYQVKFEMVLPWVGYTGLAFPRYAYHPALWQGLAITAGGVTERTIPVADIDAVAADEYRRRLPVMITRIVISYLVKETAALAATEAARHNGNEYAYWGTMLATSIYKYMFNTADTRCWETLPKEYQMLHFPIPANRQVGILPFPAAAGSQPTVIHLKNTTRFAIIYVRSVNGPVSIKVCEF